MARAAPRARVGRQRGSPRRQGHDVAPPTFDNACGVGIVADPRRRAVACTAVVKLRPPRRSRRPTRKGCRPSAPTDPPRRRHRRRIRPGLQGRRPTTHPIPSGDSRERLFRCRAASHQRRDPPQRGLLLGDLATRSDCHLGVCSASSCGGAETVAPVHLRCSSVKSHAVAGCHRVRPAR